MRRVSLNLRGWRERLRQSLWFIPAVAVLLSFLAAEAASAVDRAVGDDVDNAFVFSGSPATARSVVGTIAASMITFTGLVFSITMLVLQLASSQLSPRIMRTFLRDRGTQYTLGLFIATFTYSLLVLRRVGDDLDTGEDVSSVSVWIALVLVFASVLAFVYYIHHIAQAIRPVNVIRSVTQETIATIEQVYRLAEETPERAVIPDEEPDAIVRVPAGRFGVLVDLDHSRLCRISGGADATVEIVACPGQFLPSGSPLARVWGMQGTVDDILAAVEIGRERTMQHDVAFGVRQLVDIAVRALSPGINDPTTAAQVLDGLHEVLTRMLPRDTTPAYLIDDDPHVILRRPSWDDLVDLALDEIRHYGRGAVQVDSRLRALLEDLLARASVAKAPALRRHLDLLDSPG
jgi:uncharacterized membrane protein